MSDSGIYEISTRPPAPLPEPGPVCQLTETIVPPADLDGASPAALASFYNAPHRRRARANTAKSMIGPGERPQEIYTPQIIVDAIREVWGRIAFDPCSGPESIVNAERAAYIPGVLVPTGGLNADGTPKTRLLYIPRGGDVNGLAVEWPDFTYCNPPFALLEEWMIKAAREAGGNNPHTEIMQLVPVRPHRRWWRDVAFKSADEICWLDPVHFIGYSSGFPAPLAMLYWGDTPKCFAHAFESRDLGECDYRAV